MDSGIVDTVIAKFPGRENQINLLFKFISEEDEVTTMDFLLHGPRNTGKTAILKELLELSNKGYIFIDCSECYHPKILYETVLTELCEKKLKENGCDNIVEFMNHFESTSKSDDLKIDFIILKNCSSLGEYYVEAFINLQSNFSIIFIDQHPEIYVSTLGSHINKMQFPAYSTGELAKIIPSLRPQYDPDIFKNFLIFFLPSVYIINRDIFDILQLVDVFFAIYKKPIDEKELSANDRQGLFKRLAPHLKMNPNNLIFSFPQSEYPHEEKYESMQLSVDTEMSINTKYLLIAAYIASYISSKHDKQLFYLKSSKQKKKIKISNKNMENKVAALLGPRQFTLNRLLSIFSGLIRQRSCLSASIMQQITSLVELRLLVSVGNDDCNLDNPRYKCIADFEFVASVAKSVECDLERYLVG